jgi:hypothetical protein
VVLGLVGLFGLVVALEMTQGPPARAQEGKAKAPVWLHGLDLRCRKGGEIDFGPTTKRYGIEGFRDENNGILAYITETGSVAAVLSKDAKASTGGKSKAPVWLHGLDMRVRKAGELDFSEKTHKFGLEAFRDENANNLLYISDPGFLAVLPAPAGLKPVPEGKAKAPLWLHALDLRVRRGGEPDFTPTTKKFGIEVFKDENANSVIYISETGSIAAVPATADSKPAPEGKAKAPTWLHGLDLRVRRSDEPGFTKDTRKFGVEVFRDENGGNLIFISETGSLAVVPASGYNPPADSKPKVPTWLHGLELRCRRGGENDFTKDTK